MINNINELKQFFNNLKEEDIIFKPYFNTKKEERQYLNNEMIIRSIKDTKNLEGFQPQIIKGEERYRVAIKLSGRYTLVIVIKIEGKNLYIITAWKTSRKWQKAIQK